MTVQNTAYGIRNRLVHIVSVDQYGIKTGDGTGFCSSASLKQFGHSFKHTGRIAALCGRLSYGKTYFPLSAGKTGKRVTESNISITSLPWSLKYSATAVAVYAPRKRAMGD